MNKPTRRIASLALQTALTLGVLAATAPEARAVVLRFDFSGTLYSVVDADNFLNGTGIDTSDTFSGYFTYDPATPLTVGSPGVGGASNLGDLYITIHSGSTDYTGHVDGTMHVQKVDNSGTFSDRISINGNGATFPAAIAGTHIQYNPNPNTMQVAFQDHSQTIFSDVTTLPADIDLSDFGSANMTFAANLGSSTGYTGYYSINGTVTSISVSEVPEPAALGMLGLGSLMMLARRR